jgi:hypothetical protein
MVKVPDAATVTAKWQRRVQVAGPDYQAGVTNPSKDWASATKEAEPRYKEGVIAAANAGSFGKGVGKAGTEKWSKNTLSKGVDRWPTGVANAGSDYQTGIAPVLQAAASAVLPARYAAGDERNYLRSAAMGKAIHNATKGK